VANSAQGQDRSGYQTVGPWNGLAFGWTKATEGLTFRDPTFTANWRNMGDTPSMIMRGAYHYFHPSEDAVSQANYFLSVVRGQGLRDGDALVADIEITVGLDGTLRMSPHAALRSSTLTAGVDSKVVTRAPYSYLDVSGTYDATLVGNSAKAFLDRLQEQCPHNPILVYTNLDVGSLLANCTRYGLCIAWPEDSPPPSVSPWKDWHFWQWAFSGGYDDCDQDAYNGDRAQLQAWIDSYKPKPAPKTTAMIAEEEMPQLNMGENAITEISCSGVKAIQFFTDTGAQGGDAPQLRIAVHSEKDGFNQIVGKGAGEYTLAASGATKLTFTESDVDGLTISRYAQGAEAVVGYCLLT
jgi:GH25 family lysozyme M1 (1,4-beta-N-acetylmuramidase)